MDEKSNQILIVEPPYQQNWSWGLLARVHKPENWLVNTLEKTLTMFIQYPEYNWNSECILLQSKSEPNTLDSKKCKVELKETKMVTLCSNHTAP